MNTHERMQRESNLLAIIQGKHQGAFAADYQKDEYALLGMAINYAGLRGKEVRAIGKNKSTLREEEKIH
jgi:hypothetical protein